MEKKDIIELKDTADMMCSADYKERFLAEYHQLRIRYWKLLLMCNEWDNGMLRFTPTCPRSTYSLQLQTMYDYLAVLEARAVMEGIALDGGEEDEEG